MAVEWLRFDVTLSMSEREGSAWLKENSDVDNAADEFQSFDLGFGCYLEELKKYKIWFKLIDFIEFLYCLF